MFPSLNHDGFAFLEEEDEEENDEKMVVKAFYHLSD